MPRFLSSLFKDEAPGTAAPAKQLGIDLRSIDQALIEKEGYPRPQWERRIGGNKFGRLDRELLQKHMRHWTEQTIGQFWTGRSFYDDDGEIVHLSYSLAETLVDILAQDFPRSQFIEFVSQSHRSDAGQGAAKQCLGISLGELVSTFLGPGESAKDRSIGVTGHFPRH